jgi:outer membrane murein-binding lipoprotein Lpp
MRDFGPAIVIGLTLALGACAGQPSADYTATSQTIRAAQDTLDNALPKLRADVAACKMDQLRFSLESELGRAAGDVNYAEKTESMSPEDKERSLNSAAQAVVDVRAGVERCRHEMADLDRRLAAITKRCKTPTRIGMTEGQVEASCWGLPDHVNRTETAHHVSEQWVYPALGYLYFDNGRLEAIQQLGQ